MERLDDIKRGEAGVEKGGEGEDGGRGGGEEME